MLLDKIKFKLIKFQRNHSDIQNEILKSHMSADEIAIHPVIGDLTKKVKRIKFAPLINVKPKLTPIKDIKDEKKIKLIKNVNSFRKILYDYNKSQKYPKKDEINIYKGQKNYNFYEKYKIIKNNDTLGEKQMLEELETLYKNKDISVPSVNKNDNNLFKGNLLLLNEKNIKNSILYQLTSDKSNKNSMSFLKKIQTKINNQILGKPPLPKITKIKEGCNAEVPKDDKDNNNKTEKIFYNKQNIEEISNSHNYINSIKETINTIDDIDYFFDSNNKDYFNYLKNPNSKISTRVNSALGVFPLTNTNLNNNIKHNSAINIYDLKQNFKFNNQDTNKNNNSSLDIFKINLNKKRFSDFNDRDKNNEKRNKVINFKFDDKILSNTVKNNNRNNSVDYSKIGQIDFTKNPNLIKIKKINLNRKAEKSKTSLNLNLNSTKNNKSPNLKVQIVERPVARKRSSINYNQINITLDKSSSNYPMERRKSLPYIYGPKPMYDPKLIVEKLYDKIKDKDDTLEYDYLIKNYLKNRRYNLEAKISPSDVCNNYQVVRENIVRNDFLKRNMRLKKISGFDDSASFEKMKSDYEKNKFKINNVADEMNKVFSKLNNPVLGKYSGV